MRASTLATRTCTFERCRGSVHAKNLCNAHYQRHRLSKPLLPIRKRFLSHQEAFEANVIKSDGCWGWSGKVTTEGYAIVSAVGSTIYGHRYSYSLFKGSIPSGMFIDHTCHNRVCTNPSHLQVVDNKRNLENRAGAQSNSTTGVRGVSLNKKTGKFEASFKHWGKKVYVGRFATLAEAELAVIKARNALYTNNLLDRTASND